MQMCTLIKIGHLLDCTLCSSCFKVKLPDFVLQCLFSTLLLMVVMEFIVLLMHRILTFITFIKAHIYICSCKKFLTPMIWNNNLT